MTLSVYAPPAKPSTIEQLRKIKFLADVNEQVLQRVALSARPRLFKAKTALFHAGEPGQVLYMVVSGWVRIEKQTASDQRLVIGRRGPGTQLGELALFDGAPRMADAVTETDCELITLERDAFLKCLIDSPSASLAVMASLADMVRNAGANLVTHRSQDTLGRLAELLLRYCQTYGKAAGKGEIEIAHRTTHQSLADEIGVQRETISRALHAMEVTEAIRKEGHKIIVRSTDKLENYLAVNRLNPT